MGCVLRSKTQTIRPSRCLQRVVKKVRMLCLLEGPVERSEPGPRLHASRVSTIAQALRCPP